MPYGSGAPLTIRTSDAQIYRPGSSGPNTSRQQQEVRDEEGVFFFRLNTTERPSGGGRDDHAAHARRRLAVVHEGEHGSRYLDEASVESFRRKVGRVYPKPVKVAGVGDRWRKVDLDRWRAGDEAETQEEVLDGADFI